MTDEYAAVGPQWSMNPPEQRGTELYNPM